MTAGRTPTFPDEHCPKCQNRREEPGTEMCDPGWHTVTGRSPSVGPRRGDLEAASTRHAFRPSGEYVGASNAERCDLCGLAQRGEGTMHPPELGHGCADPDCDFLKPPPMTAPARTLSG